MGMKASSTIYATQGWRAEEPFLILQFKVRILPAGRINALAKERQSSEGLYAEKEALMHNN